MRATVSHWLSHCPALSHRESPGAMLALKADRPKGAEMAWGEPRKEDEQHYIDAGGERRRKKRDVDYSALRSHFMQVPGMDVSTARALLDLGFTRIDELQGRAPSSLFSELSDQRTEPPAREILAGIRLAVYFAETPVPDPDKLSRWAWTHADP